MRPKTLGMPYHLLYFTWIILLQLSPEMQRFTYYGIRRDDCEGTLCSSPLGKYSVSASSLISVGFCTILEWITCWFCPSWRVTSKMEGIEVSYMDSFPHVDAGSSVMPLGASWGSDTGGRSCGPRSSESSCQFSLGSEILEDELRCQYFWRVKFYCLARSECSSTIFYNLLWLWPYSCAPQWRMFSQIPHGTGWKYYQLLCSILGKLNLRGIMSSQDILRSFTLVPI